MNGRGAISRYNKNFFGSLSSNLAEQKRSGFKVPAEGEVPIFLEKEAKGTHLLKP